MAAPAFAELVSRLIQSMGQTMDSVRRSTEGILLKTGDGFLYAFLPDPNDVSLETVSRLFEDVGSVPAHLVVLTPGRLPLALSAEVLRRGGTVVDAHRFEELVRGLGLAEFLGQEPRATVPANRSRLLPSAQQLDQIVLRARTWQEWGIPALALRFYRQASNLKPEFTPARNGIGRSLLALGLVEEGERAFDEVLATHPNDLDARIGKASVLGVRGKVRDEISAYRALVEEMPDRSEIRAHLVAALLDAREWADARRQIESLLDNAPEDPPLRFLLGVSLEKLGKTAEGAKERERARQLGLPYERERTLLEHLGMPTSAPPTPAGPLPVAESAPRGRRVPKRRAPPKAVVRRPRGPTRSKPRKAEKKRKRK